MRVLIDTNVFISHLLSPQRASAINRIFSALVAGTFTLLVPEDLLVEIEHTVQARPHLVNRIRPEELAEFLHLLRVLSEEIHHIDGPIPAVTRDPKDDYLLAYALVGKADFLVTGDQDLLVLNHLIEEIEILPPAQFSAVIEN